MPEEIREVPYPAGDVYLRCDACDISYRADQALDIPGAKCPVCNKPLKPSGARSESDKTIIKLGKSDMVRKKEGRIQAGEVILGRYRIESELGRGGMGVVYKAFHLDLKIPVALKMLRAEEFEPDDLRRFLREGKTTAGLKHSNIVSIIDIITTGRTHYIVMEYIDGLTLDRWIEDRHKEIQLEKIQRSTEVQSVASKGTIVGRRNDPYGRRILEIVRGCAAALDYAHSQGVIHRDIKPQNIIIDRLDQPKVVDFGLAKQVDSHSLQTVSGTILGTPNYMAPEQAQGHISGIDARSDTYSLCAVLFYAFADRAPFTGETVYDILNSVVMEDAPPIASINPTVERDLEIIIMRGLDKEKGRRFANMRELRDDIECFLAGKPIRSKPPGVVYKGVKKIRKSRKLQIALAAAVVLIVATAIFLKMTVGMREELGDTDLAAQARLKLEESRGLDSLRALPLCDKAIEIAPRYADAHIGKARVLFDLQRMDEALSCVDTALTFDDKHPHAYYLKARIIEAVSKDQDTGAGALSEIKALYQRSLELNPEQRFAHLGKSRLLILQNDLMKAIEEVEDAIARDPKMDEAFVIRGEIMLRQERFAEAEADFTKAAEINPGSVAALIDLGSLHLLRKEYAKAAEDFTKALDITPNSFAALYNRGLASRNLGMSGRWAADWNSAAEQWPRHRYAAAMRKELAAASAEKTVPATAPAASDDGLRRILQRKSYDEARQYCLDLLKKNNDDPLLNLAIWALMMREAKGDVDIGERKTKMRQAFDREARWRNARGFKPIDRFDEYFMNGDPIWLRVRKML